jgi:nitrogen regulatory protein PII 1
MQLIRAIVRSEKSATVIKALFESGFVAVTRVPVIGRGKQRGIKVGDITYDEIPKDLLLIVINDDDKDYAIKTIMESARTGEKGAFGDGKIFVSAVDEAYTISRGTKEL